MSDQIVYILDDDETMLETLIDLVESVGYRAKGFKGVNEFLDNIPDEIRGCLILDVRMPGMSGVDLLEKLKKDGQDIPSIMVTGYGDIPSTVRAVKAGAHDFLEKPFRDQQLLDLISQCLREDEKRSDKRKLNHDIKQRMDLLTQREHQVLDLVVQGLANREIAEQFGLSTRTVEIHRANVMQKIEAKSLPELVRYYLRVNEEI